MPVPAGCTLGGQEVQLSIHYENGFSVCRPEAGGSVLFRYPYERLKMSADDGIRTLYLDFGGPEGELVRRGQLGSPPGSGDLLPGGGSCFPLSLQHRAAYRELGAPCPGCPLGRLVGCGGADTAVPLPPTPGAGPALLPQAHRLHPAHLPLGQSHPHGAAGVGGPGPPPASLPPPKKPARESGGATPLLPHQCLARAGDRRPRRAAPGWG